MAPSSTDLVMPKLGLTMTEGLLLEWRVAAGDSVEAGDVVFVVETDKVATEIEAPNAGTIEAILVEEGETVATGTPLARFFATQSSAGDDNQHHRVATPKALDNATPSAATSPSTIATKRSTHRVVATPFARRLAKQYAVDLANVSGSGPGGRIKAADIEQLSAGRAGDGAKTHMSHSRLVELNNIQATMAERVSTAARDVPHFYLTANIVIDDVLEMRKRLGQNDTAPRLSIGHFVVAALAHALALRPNDNRVWEQGHYRIFASVDIGIAVATDRGLLAPILRDAGSMTLFELASAHDALVARARNEQLTVADMSGGAITVSNLGAYGIGQVFPIINAPQSMILGVGSARPTLTATENGGARTQTVLPVVLAADHRAFDGANAAALLMQVSEALAHPNTLIERCSVDD